MDFELSDKAKAVEEQLCRFMDEYVYPAEWEYQEQAEANPNEEPSIMLELRAKAREIGLWNLFLPDDDWGAGLTNLEYTPLCEIMGRSAIAARVFNCQAPDNTKYMNIPIGKPSQRRRTNRRFWVTIITSPMTPTGQSRVCIGQMRGHR